MTAARATVLALAAWLVPVAACAFDQPVSAFASVGKGAATADGAVTLYVVPQYRTFLLTDVLVANVGGEPGPLYLADSQRTRCAIQLLQTTLMNGQAPGFGSLLNVHESFTTGLPFGPGESVLATLVGATKGVDVTISGKLVPGPRQPSGVVRLPGGAREGADAAAGGDGAKP